MQKAWVSTISLSGALCLNFEGALCPKCFEAAEEAAQLTYETMKTAVEDQKAKLTSAKINLEGQILSSGRLYVFCFFF